MPEKEIIIEKQSGYYVSCIEQIPDSCKGIVIAVHGFSSSKECSTYQVLLQKLPEAGLGLIGIDLPGHGRDESYAETLRIEACKESITAAESISAMLIRPFLSIILDRTSVHI